jgi:hypothetical protein
MRLRTKCVTLRLGFMLVMVLLVVPGARTQSTSVTSVPSQKFAESSAAPAFHIKDEAYFIAYQDVVKILKDHNDCSDFFGGPDAVSAFRELALRMTKMYSNDEAAIRMHGRQTTVSRGGSGLRYRLFEKAEINGRGSFFRYGMFGEVPKTPRVGRFAPNTREARALMLLHELGHLIEPAPGRWLLPDDGGDADKSQDNTWTVVKHCEQTIRSRLLN